MSNEKNNITAVKEKCNNHAMALLNRIQMKLDGHELLSNTQFSVAEQVDWMINEARHPDNLSVLYEGWAPWV